MNIDHIGIATRELNTTLTVWRDTLGLPLSSTEDLADQGVRVAMLLLGETHIELLEPLGPDSPIRKFLEKRGPGIHHLAIQVDDIRMALARLKENGTRLIDEVPRLGAGGSLVAFIHPSSTDGVLLELVQRQ